MPFHQEAFKKKQNNKINTNKLIWLYRVLVATCRISVAVLGLSMGLTVSWNLTSLTRDGTCVPCIVDS